MIPIIFSTNNDILFVKYRYEPKTKSLDNIYGFFFSAIYSADKSLNDIHAYYKKRRKNIMELNEILLKYGEIIEPITPKHYRCFKITGDKHKLFDEFNAHIVAGRLCR